jgi:hypothetical protein
MAGALTISTLNNDTGVLATQNGMTGIAKAWINFNGMTGAVAIRGSFNVSSITSSGTGVFTINFTTSMPNVNYAVVGSGMFSGGSDGSTPAIGPRRGVTAYNTGNIIVQSSVTTTNNLNEILYGNIAVFSS